MKSTYDDFIGIYENIVDPSLCKKLIDTYENSDRWSTKPPVDRSGPYYEDSQLALDSFNKGLSSNVMVEFKKCFRDYLGKYPLLKASNYISSLVLLQKTNPTQGYHQFHYENGSYYNCNRTMAWMIYLNNVEEGGETEWLYQKKKVKPTIGTVVIWPGGYTHFHRGNPPMSTKYIATGWIQSDWGLPEYQIRTGKDF